MGVLTKDMQCVVNEQRLAFVATVCADGSPNLSPKGTTAVWDGDHLIFADVCSPQTVENLKANPSIEINVVDPILRKGYRFKGRAKILNDGQKFEDGVAFMRKRGSKSEIKNIVLIEVITAAPLVSPAYDLGRTETDIVQQWENHFAQLRAKRQA